MKPLYRTIWLAILAAHATVAAVWWWQSPGGFAIGNPHFWVNQIAPLPIVILAIGTRMIMPRRPAIASALLLMLPVAWICASIAARVMFPISFHMLWLAPFVIGVVMLALWIVSTRSVGNRWTLAFPAFAAAALGILAPLSQRAPAASTRPLNVPAPITDGMLAPENLASIRLAQDIRVDPGSALITFTAGRYTLGVQPVLQFTSRSPDRCWTLFSPPDLRVEPPRRLLGIRRADNAVDLAYRDDTASLLRVARDMAYVTRIESFTDLSRDIYSHLNSFCELTVAGHKRLFLVFSPCPDRPIEVTWMEYPRGKPARLAYLDGDGIFHVVEAAGAEKGPYRELARGRLTRSDPLSITLLDESRQMFEVTLDDWAAQSATAGSPTAGWNLPQNAIEFSLDSERASSSASIFITLAATSVGLGYDSVGHVRGAYRNRIRVTTNQVVAIDFTKK